jgi:hypothetical protein
VGIEVEDYTICFQNCEESGCLKNSVDNNVAEEMASEMILDSACGSGLYEDS